MMDGTATRCWDGLFERAGVVRPRRAVGEVRVYDLPSKAFRALVATAQPKIAP
jgi:hypothetical protein